ncbi:hypothetical protein SEVIR_7G243901v4 [Setaria viridis]
MVHRDSHGPRRRPLPAALHPAPDAPRDAQAAPPPTGRAAVHGPWRRRPAAGAELRRSAAGAGVPPRPGVRPGRSRWLHRPGSRLHRRHTVPLPPAEAHPLRCRLPRRAAVRVL